MLASSKIKYHIMTHFNEQYSLAVACSDHIHDLPLDIHPAVATELGALPQLGPGVRDGGVSLTRAANYPLREKNDRLDWESIRSSPRDGSSTFYRLTKVGWVLVGGWVWWVGWLAPKISMSSSGILKMVHQLRLMMFLLKMVDYSMSLLLLST